MKEGGREGGREGKAGLPTSIFLREASAVSLPSSASYLGERIETAIRSSVP